MKSYKHDGIKAFLLACGCTGSVRGSLIDCARAIEEPLLRSLMDSTFISYGGPDEAFRGACTLP